MDKEFLSTILARTFGLISSLILSVITARYLGVEGRGTYFLVISAAQMTIQFGNLGLVSSNTYFVADKRELSPALMANSIWISLVSGAVFSLIVAQMFDLSFMSGGNLWIFVLAIAIPSLLFMLGGNLLVGMGQVHAFNMHQVMFFALILIFYLGVVWTDGGLYGLLLSSASASAIVGITITAFVYRGSKKILAFSLPLFRKGFSFAFRAYVVTFLGMLLLRGIVVLMNFQLGEIDIGYFSIAAQIGDAIAIFPQSLALVLFPRLVRAGSERWNSVGVHVGITAGIMAVLCLIAYFVADLFIVILFGDAFLPSVSVLHWLLPGIFFLGIANVLGQYLAAAGMPWKTAVVWLLAVLITVSTAWQLMPTMKAAGAAASLSIGYFALLVFMYIAVRIERRSSFKSRSENAECRYIVLSGYPLSKDFKSQLSENFGEISGYVELAKLRELPVVDMLRELWGMRCSQLIVALEDPTSAGILPILRLIASLTRARRLSVLRHDLKSESLSRLGTLFAMVPFLGASLAGIYHVRKATREAGRLAKMKRDFSPENAGQPICYLNANLWFGVKAGGSVGHISGVANGFLDSGADLKFCSVGGHLLVDESRARFADLEPPRTYGMPFEVNYYRFNDLVIKALRKTYAASRPRFIYQRLSISNYAGAVLSRDLQVPLVVEYNGSEVWIANNWGRPLRFGDAALNAEEAMLKHAHLVVTISNVLRDELIERGIKPGRIVTYPNCIDPAMFDPGQFTDAGRNALLESIGMDPQAKVATFIGTFGQWHGVDILAKAIRKMCRRDAQWLDASGLHFMVIGDGLKMPEVRETLSDPACKGRYTLTGLVPQKEAPAYLAASDLLLSPHAPNADGTRFFGSPTKLFEYMAMGKPIVASDLDQIGEVLANSVRAPFDSGAAAEGTGTGKLSVLVEPGSVDELIAGIRFAVDNPDFAARLGVNARAEALAKYTWRHHVEAILTGLEQQKE